VAAPAAMLFASGFSVAPKRTGKLQHPDCLCRPCSITESLRILFPVSI